MDFLSPRSEAASVLPDTLGAARKAGLHLACGHDDQALPPTDCILSNVGELHLRTSTPMRATPQPPMQELFSQTCLRIFAIMI